MNKDLEADIHRILNHYTNQEQQIVLIEEMAELTKEITKDIRRLNKDNGGLIEELADVTIMLIQLRIIIGLKTPELQKVIRQKVDRQLRRIGLLE